MKLKNTDADTANGEESNQVHTTKRRYHIEIKIEFCPSKLFLSIANLLVNFCSFLSHISGYLWLVLYSSL